MKKHAAWIVTAWALCLAATLMPEHRHGSAVRAEGGSGPVDSSASTLEEPAGTAGDHTGPLKVVLRERFSESDGTLPERNDAISTLAVRSGRYAISISEPHVLEQPEAQLKKPSARLTIEVDVAETAPAGAAGVACMDDAGFGFQFQIRARDHRFFVLEVHGDTAVELDRGRSRSIVPGGPNHLAAGCTGDGGTLLVNGHRLSRVAGAPGGDFTAVRLYVEAGTHPAAVTYDDLVVSGG
jgi:hypothetical protein